MIQYSTAFVCRIKEGTDNPCSGQNQNLNIGSPTSSGGRTSFFGPPTSQARITWHLPIRATPEDLAYLCIPCTRSWINPKARIDRGCSGVKADLVDPSLALKVIGSGHNDVGIANQAKLLIFRQLKEIFVVTR